MEPFEMLTKRAVADPEPDWPKDAIPGRRVTAYIIIDKNGAILCADVTDSDSAVIEATKKWKFRPFLKDGIPISVMGRLEFIVPHPMKK